MTDTLRESVEQIRAEYLRLQQAGLTCVGNVHVSMVSCGDVATRLLLALAAHPAPEPGRCTCGLPDCSDEPDTAGDEQPTPGALERITPCRRSPVRDRWECITWPDKPTAYPCVHDHSHCDYIGCVEHVDGMHVDKAGDAIVHVGCGYPSAVPAGSDTPDEPSTWCLCGIVDDRHDGTCGTCGLRIMADDEDPAAPVPSPAPEDERCTCGDFAGTSVHYVDCPIHGQSASEDEREYDPFGDPDPVPTNWWHTQSGRAAHDAALVADAERRAREQVIGEIRRHADHMESYTLPAISPGFIDGFRHALRLLRRDADFIAARAATKAVSDD